MHRASPASPGAWMQALGGAGNVVALESAAGRLLVAVREAAQVDTDALVKLGARAVGTPSTTSVHVLHEDAAALREALASAAG